METQAPSPGLLPEAPPPENPRPDPATLTPQERISRIMQYRARIQNNEELPEEDLAYAIELYSTEQAAAGRQRRSEGDKARKASKPNVSALADDEL